MGRLFDAAQMSDAICDWPWAIFLKLQSNPKFVAASAVPECVQEGPSCLLRLAFTSIMPRDRSENVPRHLEIYLRSASACWLPDRPSH